MKRKIYVPLLAVFFWPSVFAHAEFEQEVVRTRFEFHPLQLALGTVAGSANLRVDDWNFLGVGFSATQGRYDKTRTTGGSLSLLETYRVQAGNNYPVLRLELGGGRLMVDDSRKSYGEREANYFNGRGSIGYNWNLGNGIGILLSGGAGYINGLMSEKKEKKIETAERDKNDHIRIGQNKVYIKKNDRFGMVYPHAELAVAYSF